MARELDIALKSLNLSKKNYIINGAMMVSQENGTSSGTTDGFYPVDQFFMNALHDGTVTVAQVASVTPAGSPNRLRATVTSTDTSIAAGQYSLIHTKIEGLRSADLRFGLAPAKTVTLQFGIKAPAGTYCVAIRNSAANRSYITDVVVGAGEANTDTIKTVTVAGDTSGTWLTTNGVGFSITWALACGSTLQTTANAWASGNYHASSNQSNFLATNASVFELFDVGLYEGSVAPTFRVPDYADEERGCQRYFEKTNFIVGTAAVNATSTPQISWKVTKRIAPALSQTFDVGTGATFSQGNLGTGIIYQNVAHSTIATATVTGNSRL